MSARLLSLNVGTIGPLAARGRTVLSAIDKRPVEGPRHVGQLGVEGDAQADPGNHGGHDKAVNVYPAEHLARWAEALERPMPGGAFGENFTTEGLSEETVAIGQRLKIGGALFEVSQPRQPCFKLAARHELPMLVKLVEESGLTGFYLRCLEPGDVEAGNPIELAEPPEVRVTIAEANRALQDPRGNPERVARVLAQPALSAAWRETLAGRSGGG